MSNSIQFYCHYNRDSGEICKISPQSERDDCEDQSTLVFEIPEDIAISMLSGTTSPSNWTAVKNTNAGGCPYELIRKDGDLKNNCSRVDGLVIAKLQEGPLSNADDLHVSINKKELLIDVYVNIRTLALTNEQFVYLFMTAHNDSSYLINTFKVDLQQLKRDIQTYDTTDICHARQRFKCDIIPEKFSFFMIKIFNFYTMDIQNDSI